MNIYVWQFGVEYDNMWEWDTSSRGPRHKLRYLVSNITWFIINFTLVLSSQVSHNQIEIIVKPLLLPLQTQQLQ